MQLYFSVSIPSVSLIKFCLVLSLQSLKPGMNVLQTSLFFYPDTSYGNLSFLAFFLCLLFLLLLFLIFFVIANDVEQVIDRTVPLLSGLINCLLELHCGFFFTHIQEESTLHEPDRRLV